jgi:Carboxypeptidase regulatory-like domain
MTVKEMTANDEDFTRPKWRRLLLNRFVVVPALLMLGTAGWNGWVATHNHGIVAGRVLDASGAPVAGADVKLWVFNFATFVVKASTTTGPDGSFTFENNPSHNIQISAEKPGLGRSARISVRLYFAAQDFRLKQPLRLMDGA